MTSRNRLLKCSLLIFTILAPITSSASVVECVNARLKAKNDNLELLNQRNKNDTYVCTEQFGDDAARQQLQSNYDEARSNYDCCVAGGSSLSDTCQKLDKIQNELANAYFDQQINFIRCRGDAANANRKLFESAEAAADKGLTQCRLDDQRPNTSIPVKVTAPAMN